MAPRNLSACVSVHWPGRRWRIMYGTECSGPCVPACDPQRVSCHWSCRSRKALPRVRPGCTRSRKRRNVCCGEPDLMLVGDAASHIHGPVCASRSTTSFRWLDIGTRAAHCDNDRRTRAQVTVLSTVACVTHLRRPVARRTSVRRRTHSTRR